MSSNNALMVKDIESVSGEDPFKMDESDPAKSDALKSSLWEIKVCIIYLKMYVFSHIILQIGFTRALLPNY